MKNSKGVSIIELLIATGIGVILIAAAAQFFIYIFGDLASGRKDLDLRSDQMLIEKKIAQSLSFSDIRNLALTGSAVIDSSHARFMKPQASVCADLSTGGVCAGSTALTYSTIRRAGIAVQAYCWLVSGATLIVERTPALQLFSATGPSTDVIGIDSPPVLSLWHLLSPIQSMPAIDVNTGSPLPTSCISYLPRNGMNQIDVASLAVLSVRPVYLQNAGAAVPMNIVTRMAQAFPTRIQNIDFFSLGLVNTASGTNFAVIPCSYQAPPAFSCVYQPTFEIKNIQRNYLIEEFSYAFSATPTTTGFQVSGGSLGLSGTCVNPSCLPMTIASNVSSPYFWGAETISTVQGANFSYVKQDLLRAITIVFVGLDNKESKAKVFLQVR